MFVTFLGFALKKRSSNKKMMMANSKRMKNSSGGDMQVELVSDILSRLPLKSLTRFKCLSKHWLSLIEDDDYFIDLYHSRSKLRSCLVLFVPIHVDFPPPIEGSTYILPRPFQANILTADLCEGVGTKDTKIGHSVTKTTSIKFDQFIDEERLCYDEILKPVNGLICFTDTTIEYGVCIYNMGTQELTPWMSTTFWHEGGHADPKFQFGFDPVTKEHKVICLWKQETWCHSRGDPVYVGCQVLTLGDNTWRSIDIDQVPQYELEHDSFSATSYGSVYVNGSIYWITSWLTYIGNSEEKVIVAFDVGSEKFRTIPVPKFIADQVNYDTDHTDSRGSSRDLLEVNGHVALVCRVPGGHTVKLWILECDHTTSCNQNWIERTIELPFPWDGNRRVVFHGIPGTYEVLIETYENRPRNIKCISLASYNYKTMTYRKVDSDELNHFDCPKESNKRGVLMSSIITPFSS